MTKIKGTAQIKIYDPNIPNSERYMEISNYVTEYMYRRLYFAGNTGLNPYRNGHFNIFIANRAGYTINKTGVSTRFTYNANLGGTNQSGGLLGYGLKPTSQISPIAYTTDDIIVPFVQFFNRINPPSNPISFNIIGLCLESSQATVYPCTILMVEPICNQSTTEFIDVVYNLEIVKGNSYFFGNQFPTDWVHYYVNNNVFNMHSVRCSYCNLPQNITQTNGYEFLNVRELSNFNNYDSTLFHQNQHPPLKHGKYINLSPATSNNTGNSALGFVINTLFLGEGTTTDNYNKYPYYWESNPSIGTSPFQSKFNKKPDALYPFWEPTDTPNASGDIIFSGTWNPNTRFPEIMKILIVNGGSIGTATYRIQVKKFVRLCAASEGGVTGTNLGNTWDMSRGDSVPFLNPVKPHPRHHGTALSCPKAAWKDERVLMYDMTGITILNLYDGTFQTWDNESTPALNVTAICQCEPVPSLNLLYVACRATGLYVINTTANTVVRLSPDPCYGVCVGGSGKVYAVFEGRISNSDSWTTPLSLVSAGITTGNTPDAMVPSWSRVRYIKANPWDTTDKLAIIITKNTGATQVFSNGNTLNGYVVWWSPTLGSTPCVVNTSGTQITTHPGAVACHPTTDSWIVPYNCLVKWGSSTPIVSNITIPYTYYPLNWNFGYKSSAGTLTQMESILGWNKWFGNIPNNNTFDLGIYYANFYNGYVLGRDCLINPDTGVTFLTTNSFALYQSVNWDQGGSAILIRGDLFLQWGPNMGSFYQLNNLFRNHATNGPRTQGWIDYGWNGTTWVEGSTTPRTTHTSASPGPNGVTVQFINGTVGSVPSFIPGQYMLQYLCNGLLIDNTVSWYYEVNRYFTDYVTQSFPVGFNVPSTPNNGTFYEVTLPKYKKIPQSNTYGWVDDGTTSGIDPDPDFYSADMQSKRSFNIALGGVTVPYTSIFYWSEKATPGPMEISIEYTNQRIDRRLRFNVADAGKAITGTYVYMKCPT